MTNETLKMLFCADKVTEMLDCIRPNHKWEIAYDIPEHVSLTDWDRKYLNLIDGEKYFFIFIEDKLTYAVNVTGDSILTAIQELINKLAAKF